MPHYPTHLLMGVAALAATFALWSLTINRLVKRKLKLSFLLLAGYVALHLALLARPELAGADANADLASPLRPLERLALTAAVLNLLVIGLINPHRRDVVRDRFPAIVQDAIVIGLLLIVATFVFNEQLLTTSAVGAVVVGFALQDTLGNAFAGLAIQSERPFNIGHWIKVGDYEGRVAEVTWRATKIRTKSDNFIVVPNNIIAKEAITNYSEPAAPTRLEVDIGASYAATPPAVKAAMLEALAHCSHVLQAPAPEVLLVGFGDSAITYRAHFWIANYELDDRARDQVRVAMYYAFGRHRIEIPYPIQAQYDMEVRPPDHAAERRQREEMLAGVDLFATLTDAQRSEIAAVTVPKTYGDGETIVREGHPGESMYVVSSGRVAVLIGADMREVAIIERGGYFGEMSLLTGEPRTATVVARGETVVLELGAELFRRVAEESPNTVEQVGLAAVTRRAELDRHKTAALGTAIADVPAPLLARMRKFLRLGERRRH